MQNSAGKISVATPAIVVERERASADVDVATLQTIRKMCEYRRAGSADPEVQRCADYAWRRFGAGSPDPAMKCWGVFWWLKHCIKFRVDEATMFRVGTRDEQDLLIAPAVLVRMKDPAEDCDGFTMLAAAMLAVLDVPVVIATVAADPRDPGRWSHVFPCAILPSGVLPIDASHGVGPGWMVPPDRIYRWRAYSLNAEPVDVEPMRYRGLHGYVQKTGRGFGDVMCPDGTSQPTMTDCLNAGSWPGGGGGSTTPASGAGSSWDTFLQSLITQGVKLTAAIATPPAYVQTTRDQYGNVVNTTVRAQATPVTAATAGASQIGSIGNSPMLWIGGGLLGLAAVLALSKGKS